MTNICMNYAVICGAPGKPKIVYWNSSQHISAMQLMILLIMARWSPCSAPPQEMAQTLMEEVTVEERNAYSRNILLGKAVAIAMALCFVFFFMYIMFIKEITVIEYKEYTNAYQAYETSEEMESVP